MPLNYSYHGNNNEQSFESHSTDHESPNGNPRVLDNNNYPNKMGSKADIRYVNTFLAIYDLETVKNKNAFSHRGFERPDCNSGDDYHQNDNLDLSSKTSNSNEDNENDEDIIVDIEGDSAIAVQQ